MSNLKIIQHILHDEYKSANQNIIEEINLDHKNKPFDQTYIIENVNNLDYLLYRFDHTAFPFFKEISGLKKMCDYILFTEWKNQLKIFVIELKQTNDRANSQLEAASEFVHYIVKSAKRVKMELDSSYSVWKIRICNSKIKKNKVKMSERIQFNADGFCDYQLTTVRIDQLFKIAK